MLIGSGTCDSIWLSWKCIWAPLLILNEICVDIEYVPVREERVVVVVFDELALPVIVSEIFASAVRPAPVQ
jgi:hypothetical protein